MPQILTLRPFNGVICCSREIAGRIIPTRFRDYESIIPRLPRQTGRGATICFPFDTTVREKIINPHRFGDAEAVLLAMKYLYFNYVEKKWCVSEMVIYPDTTIGELESHDFKVAFFA